MIRVNVVVEGQTEEGFVKQVLSPYLFEKKNRSESYSCP